MPNMPDSHCLRIPSLTLSLLHTLNHMPLPRGSHFLSISEVLSALSCSRTHFASSTTPHTRTPTSTTTAIPKFLYCCSNPQCPRGTSGPPADSSHAHRSSALTLRIRAPPLVAVPLPLCVLWYSRSSRVLVLRLRRSPINYAPLCVALLCTLHIHRRFG